MQSSKLEKIKELARRGVGGEKITAQRILKEKGISWEEPVRKVYAPPPPPEVIEKFKFDTRLPSDILFLDLLKDECCAINRRMIISSNNIYIECTMKEYMKITMRYEKKGARESFYQEMNRLGKITISKL